MQKILKLTLIIVMIIIGILIGVQIKTIKLFNRVNLDARFIRTKELNEDLIKLLEKRDEQRKIIEELYNKIDKLETEKSETFDNKEIIELQRYKKLAGFTDITGKGIKISITPNFEEEDLDTGLSLLLLKLISVLNITETEAISINGTRYNQYTEIENTNSGIIINKQLITFPIIIEAIGNKDIIIPSLKIKNGIIDSLNRYGYNVVIEENENIEIRASNEYREFKYAK